VQVTLEPDDMEALNTISELPREYPGWMLQRQGDPGRAPPGDN